MTTTLLLSIWGAAIATMLGILRVMEFLLSRRRSLQLDACVSLPWDSVSINVTNVGTKCIYLTLLDVGYGPPTTDSTVLYLGKKGLPFKLDEGQQWTTEVPRANLVEAARSALNSPVLGAILNVRVSTSLGKSFRTDVEIAGAPFALKNRNSRNKRLAQRFHQAVGTMIFLGWRFEDIPDELVAELDRLAYLMSVEGKMCIPTAAEILRIDPEILNRTRAAEKDSR